MKIVTLSSHALLPKKGSVNAAGYDLYSIETGVIKPKERRLIPTGISLAIPSGYYGRIAPRSGLAFKHGIDVMAGVIDSDYRGEVGVILYNSDSFNDFIFNIGDKIAQIIFEKHYDFVFNEVFQIKDLNETQRGSGGFGSTGI
jgi:dUTP pyrophosphatase